MKDSYLKHNHKLHIIVGCGRLGASVASMLSSNGVEVAVIDISKDALSKLPASYTGFIIEADACDTHVLEKADIKKAGAVLVATGDDNINLMVSQIAKVVYETPVVVTRLYDTDKEALLAGTGIGAIYPIKLELAAFRDIVGMTAEE